MVGLAFLTAQMYLQYTNPLKVSQNGITVELTLIGILMDSSSIKGKERKVNICCRSTNFPRNPFLQLPLGNIGTHYTAGDRRTPDER